MHSIRFKKSGSSIKVSIASNIASNIEFEAFLGVFANTHTLRSPVRARIALP